MAFKVKMHEVLLWIDVCVITFCAVFGFFLVQSRGATENLGITAVKLMYEFEKPEDLNAQYRQLRKIVSDDTWEVLNFDNELRVVNTYFKFDYNPSQVEIHYYRDGLILYNLKTAAVPEGTLWAFQYEINHGKIDKVREYQLVSLYDGKEGGLIA